MTVDKYLRLASLDDIPKLMKFARNFWLTSPYKSMKFDPIKGESFLRDIVAGNKMDAIILVALDEGEAIGFLVGASDEPAFSRAKIAVELGWWIEPDRRGTRASFLIYKAYEDWARRIGCSHVQGAYLPGVSPSLDEFYKKRGYIQVETSYLKVLKL